MTMIDQLGPTLFPLIQTVDVSALLDALHLFWVGRIQNDSRIQSSGTYNQNHSKWVVLDWFYTKAIEFVGSDVSKKPPTDP